MALALNPATRVITIPQADLTFVSGDLYELDTDQFRKDVMTLLASQTYIWLPDAFQHNTEVTIVGTTYARLIEFINGFSITFEDLVYSVRLAGSNNNIFDVENGILNPSGNVTVIGQNSAGLQTIISGSGLSATQATQLAEIFKLLGLDVTDRIVITPTGVDSDSGDIDIDFTGDGVSETTMERQP